MADSKISALPSGAPAQAADEYIVARSGANYKLTLTNIAASMPPIGATTPNTGAFTTVDATSVEVTNIKAKDGTAAISIADSTGAVTVSTKAEFADGSASAPAITNTGDTNTGVYFPAADEVAVVAGGSVAAAFNSNGLFFRNRIINGDMRIDQRNAGAAVTTTNSYAVDRFLIQNVTDGAFSLQQDTSVPTGSGFVNSIKFTTTTADGSLASTQNITVQHRIEGTNVADLMWGSASARTVTLSFWVRSSLTGTFGGTLVNSALDRSYPFTYSISVADTWEYKTVTIPGDTTGTWLTTTSVGIRIYFGLGVGTDRSGTAGAWAGANYNSATGAVSVIGTLNATWYVTGVQLETGSVATPFERRPYGTELMLCQRYYYRLKSTGLNYPFGFAQCYSTTAAGALIQYPVTMRVAPSALEQSGTATDYALYTSGGAQQLCSAVPAYASVLTTTAYGSVNFTVAANIVAGNVTQATGANSTAYLGWSAEL